MKKLLALSVFFACFLFLSGCGPSLQPEPPPSGTASLTVKVQVPGVVTVAGAPKVLALRRPIIRIDGTLIMGTSTWKTSATPNAEGVATLSFGDLPAGLYWVGLNAVDGVGTPYSGDASGIDVKAAQVTSVTVTLRPNPGKATVDLDLNPILSGGYQVSKVELYEAAPEATTFTLKGNMALSSGHATATSSDGLGSWHFQTKVYDQTSSLIWTSPITRCDLYPGETSACSITAATLPALGGGVSVTPGFDVMPDPPVYFLVNGTFSAPAGGSVLAAYVQISTPSPDETDPGFERNECWVRIGNELPHLYNYGNGSWDAAYHKFTITPIPAALSGREVNFYVATVVNGVRSALSTPWTFTFYAN